MIYQSPTLTIQQHQDGIAELQFCNPGSVNKLDRATLESLDEGLTTLAKTPNVRGLILTSNKSSFIVGADITEFFELFALPAEALDNWLRYANDIFNRLEDLPYPTVAAIAGHALGGGCECVLACDLRIAGQSVQIGLPETRLGIMPGFGGCVRLPRLIGADNAMTLITQGKQCRGKEAMALGLVDAVVSDETLQASGLSLLKDAINGQIDWQKRRAKKTAKLELSPIEAAMSFNTAKGLVMQKAGPHYPAPLKAVTAIEQGHQHSRNGALDIERQLFAELTQTPQARALVGIFLNDQYVKAQTKGAAKLASSTQRPAVIGAGIMGGGIAYQAASKGLPVIMKDVRQAALELGMDEAINLLNKKAQRGRLDAKTMAKQASAIQPTLDYSAFGQVDMVVEAVVENPEIKQAVLADIEQQVSDETILTSNTSTIPINHLAKALKDKTRFCGMHFFNPVHKMPLVEIIRGEHTSDDTINKVVVYASQLGKTPIVVNDCPGFFVNRVLFPYFMGFGLLIGDGADFVTIDKVMEKQFGWPMGPAYLLDVVGIDTANHAQQVMAQGFPERMQIPDKDLIGAMHQQNRLGQKSGAGFYRYQKDKKGRLVKADSEDISPLLDQLQRPETEAPSKQEILERMMIPMINEVVLCLEQGIIASPQEADIALVYGLGFPPFRGGVCRYLDELGIENYIKMASQYQDLGPLYRVPELLYKMQAEQQTFYAQQPNSAL